MIAHMPALKSLPQYAVTAVSTTRQSSANEAAKRFEVPHAFDHADALIDITEGTSLAPNFHDALGRHRLLDAISTASTTGQRQRVSS